MIDYKKQVIYADKTLTGSINDAAVFLRNEQLTDSVLWKRFVDQFRNGIDGENRGWRGEYWGKMLRGGVLVYELTGDTELYRVLTQTVLDILTVMEQDGRVSSYAREKEFDGWDLWCRKYVLLGMEYYLDVCEDTQLRQQILEFLCRSMDYILAHIGPEKKRITACSRNWLGLNSSSILEPVVRLYGLTGNQAYLDFASYIVREGGAEGVNIFELAYENKLLPYQYGVNKAYEMMSCFEGLLEYALVTGSEKYTTACVNFTKGILQSDVTIIGSCGCSHELLDHSAVRQTAYEPGVMQETCVTVTWIKLCGRMLALTGESIYADAMEKAFYNAYLGALNTDHNACEYIRERYVEKNPVEGLVDTFLPFDSYSPLRAGTRGRLVGGLQLLEDKSYYGCCTSIGAAGVGVMAKHMLMENADGVFIEFYEAGTYAFTYRGVDVQLKIQTDYPAQGDIHIIAEGEHIPALHLRIPGWCDAPRVNCAYTTDAGYMVVRGCRDIHLQLPMVVKAHLPQSWTEDVIWTNRKNAPAGWSSTGPQPVFHQPEEDAFVAFTRGPLTLCADSRTGKAADSVFCPVLPPVAQTETAISGRKCLVTCRLEGVDGTPITLLDYASAGKDWKTPIAAWLRTK